MPEIAWTTALTWGTLVTVPLACAALIHLWAMRREYTRGRAAIAAVAQATQAEIGRGFADTERALRQTAALLHHRTEEPPAIRQPDEQPFAYVARWVDGSHWRTGCLYAHDRYHAYQTVLAQLRQGPG